MRELDDSVVCFFIFGIDHANRLVCVCVCVCFCG